MSFDDASCTNWPLEEDAKAVCKCEAPCEVVCDQEDGASLCFEADDYVG